MFKIKFIKNLLIVFALIFANLHAQNIEPKDAAEIQLALKKLNVAGSVLYVAAHPDDENTSVLAYFNKEQLVESAYLSLTRGSGGQNLIGKEKNELLGILRTQELLSARKIDGARQFFTRAIDFGYSKTAEETIEIWNREKILSDIIWVIRRFRPDIIITRFTSELGGHGHHLASAILALEAFQKAGNPQVFPEQLKYVDTWEPKRIFWDVWQWRNQLEKMDTTKLARVNVGKFNPLLGQSYTEIGAHSRSMHKSQGFGASSRRGTYREFFQLLDGDSANSNPLQDVDINWSRVEGTQDIQNLLNKAYREFQPERPAAVLPILLNAYRELENLPQNHWIQIKQAELKQVIADCAGLWLNAEGMKYFVSPNGNLKVELTAINRSNYPIQLTGIDLPFQNADTALAQMLKNNKPWKIETTIHLPENAAFSQPYWLKQQPLKGTYQATDPNLRGLAESKPPIMIGFTIRADNNKFEYEVPVRYRWTDPVEGERYRDVEIVPPMVVEFDQKVYVFSDNRSKEITVKLKSTQPNVSGNLKLQAPRNWTIQPASVNFTIPEAESESTFQFTVHPAQTTGRDTVRAIIENGNKKLSYTMHQIDYSHIPLQTVLTEAQAKFVRVAVKRNKERLGYIMGPGDDIPQSLRQLGYQVEMLTKKDVESGNLQPFDAIITGIRAYNTNDWLKNDHPQLLDYVYNGGTLVMQYNVTRGIVLDTLGPYPFNLSRDRVTVEEAPIKFMAPDHPILNYPNKITQQDFDGWVQERGLYFANKWDPQYQPILSSHDPGEDPKAGGLLFTNYGKGVFIYTGYAFFRQLPAGVPGAFRLFVNLIEAKQK